MTLLDRREQAFETEFAHQEELKFRAREGAVKGLARWAAERLGKTGEAIEAYAKEAVAFDVSNPTPEPTIERIAAALAPKGVGKAEVRRMMDQFMLSADAALRSAARSTR